MIILLLVLAVLCIWNLQISGYHDNFLSKVFTTPIKGIFTYLIFCSHIKQYVLLSSAWYDASYLAILNYLGQLMVAMFFFYSGFGIWESFRKKPGYVRLFFKNRFIKTLLHFDVAVAIYVLVQLLIPILYSPKEYLLCWIGWESVGNSNWFIFVILCLYMIALTAMWIHQKNGRGGIVITIAASAALWILLRMVAKRPSWWIDTIAAFPLGALVSRFKESIIPLMNRKGWPYIMTGLGLAFFLLSHKVIGIDIYGGVTCFFCIAVVLFSSWIKIGNPVLNWLGNNAFTIYIIQRLPMIVLSSMGLHTRVWLFIPLTILMTILLAESLSRLNARLDKRLFANA